MVYLAAVEISSLKWASVNSELTTLSHELEVQICDFHKIGVWKGCNGKRRRGSVSYAIAPNWNMRYGKS